MEGLEKEQERQEEFENENEQELGKNLELEQNQEQDQERDQDSEHTQDQGPREEIFSRAVRAGKRTYFFDVKATRKNDYYLTITESKKRFNKRGRFYFEKFKIFLYKEDFEKFTEGLGAAIEFINDAYVKGDFNGHDADETTSVSKEEDYTTVEFDDLKEN